MSKYDPLIHEFLVRNKKIALEKIGEFLVSSESVSVDSNGNSVSIPQVEFKYSRRTETSPEFIEYLANHFSKTTMLIEADFASALEQARQYINIGKSYAIPQVGIISMTKTGEYEFTQHATAYKTEEKQQSRQHAPESVLEDRARSKKGITAIAVVIILLILAGAGWGAYSYFSGKNKNTDIVDSTASAPPVTDTTHHAPDSTSSVKPADNVIPPAANNTKDSMTLRFVFETTSSGDRARSRTAQLRSFGDPAHYDSTISNGDTSYKLFLRNRVAIADTARIRDSLQLYFQRKVTIQ